MTAYKPTAVIADELLTQVYELRTLANTQAQIINEKNDEIAQLHAHIADLEAALQYAQLHDYADDLALDSEAGAIDVSVLNEVTA